MADELFQKKYSAELQDYSLRFLKLIDRNDKINSVTDVLVFPVEGVKRLSADIDGLNNDILAAKPETEFEHLLLMNLSERLNSMRLSLNEYYEREFDYTYYLKTLGINEKDIREVIEHLKHIDLQSEAEKLLGSGESLYRGIPESKEEIKKIEEYYDEFVRLSYEVASPMLTKLFKDYPGYRGSVELMENRNNRSSYSRTGKVYLNTFSPDVITVKRDLRWTNIIDVFSIADIVGEEGILGHQGQFLATESSDIPQFLKKVQMPACTVNAEAIAIFGKHVMVDLLKNKRDMAKDINDKDFDLLSYNLGIRESSDKTNRFVNAYADYFYFTKNREIGPMSDEVFKIIRSPWNVSGVYKERIKAYFNTKFWENYKRSISVWAYAIADVMAMKFEKRLAGFDFETRSKILAYMQLGFWSKNSYEAYFDYLVKELA
jgi:hypothetical protein